MEIRELSIKMAIDYFILQNKQITVFTLFYPHT